MLCFYPKIAQGPQIMHTAGGLEHHEHDPAFKKLILIFPILTLMISI